jgi:hypothetical protein
MNFEEIDYHYNEMNFEEKTLRVVNHQIDYHILVTIVQSDQLFPNLQIDHHILVTIVHLDQLFSLGSNGLHCVKLLHQMKKPL